MRVLLVLSISFLFSLTAFGQKPIAVDSGFTNKDSAKNLLVNGLKEGRWVEYIGDTGEVTTDTSASSYYLTIYKADKPYGIQREYAKGGRLQFEAIEIPGKKDPRAIFFNYYPNGKLQSEFSYMGDKPDGKFKWYYENGKLKNETDYALGVKGAMKFYDEQGNKISLTQFNMEQSGFTNKDSAQNRYKDSLKEGKWVEYLVREVAPGRKDTIGYYLTIYKHGRPSGMVRFYWNNNMRFVLEHETPYVNGLKNGLEKGFCSSQRMSEKGIIFIDGIISTECMYVNDKRVGVEKGYYENGTLKFILPFKDGRENGVEKNYYEDGKLNGERIYLNGKEVGVEKFYYENGALHIEMPFTNGNINGVRKEYYENGKLMSEDPYVNSKEKGIAKRYYENGVLKEEIPYIDNQLVNGIHKWYYESGNIKQECPITLGYPNGINKEYYENGSIMSETPDTAEFINSSIHNSYINGDVRKYYEDGKIKSETIYINGVAGETKNYDENDSENSSISKSNKLLIHKWVQGNWEEDYANQYDSSEIIRNKLIGTWIDSSFRMIGMIGSSIVEHKVYKDSIVTTTKWRPSEYYHLEPMDSEEVAKHKYDKPDTTLHIVIEKHNYKIVYVDERGNNTVFKGYAIIMHYDNDTNLSDNNLDNFNEVQIISVFDKYLTIEAGTWCPCVSRSTEIYRREDNQN